ncbi:MAG: hypothetical protein JO180_11980 [Gemmatirosa sp.]|nr:hypothetical protein [Gemmatirosa sp.]
MPLWDKVKQELDRAGRVAQDALDEGRVRLEAFRARQHADRAAQALGYAVFRARSAGAELETAAYERLSATLAKHESEAARLEAQLDEIQGRRGPADRPADTSPDASADAPPAGASAESPPSADTISPTDTGTP